MRWPMCQDRADMAKDQILVMNLCGRGDKDVFTVGKGALIMTTRIDTRFENLKSEGRPALVTYFMGGDPSYDTSLEIMKALPGAGSDVIELGMPFSDPMADGPAIQMAGQRALKAGQTLARTLDLARDFRVFDNETPIVLMGYYNPIYIYGVERFLVDAKEAGIDGLIVVDLPPEMDEELCLPALKAGLNFIRLATPTTDDKRSAAGFEQHLRLRVLCVDDRHYRIGDRRHLKNQYRGRPDQEPHGPAGLCRLRCEDRRTGARHRAVRGRRGCRHRDRQPDRQHTGWRWASNHRYSRKRRHHGARTGKRRTRRTACTGPVTVPH
jgi:hypothetical protein